MGIIANNGALGEMRSLVVDTMILQGASAPDSAIRVPSKAGRQATQLDTLWTCAAICLRLAYIACNKQTLSPFAPLGSFRSSRTPAKLGMTKYRRR